MDTIFLKTTNWFDCVRIARNEPNRYDKEGRLVIAYGESGDGALRRRSVGSVVGGGGQEKTAGAEDVGAGDEKIG